MADPIIVWLRQDLRLHDQPALVAAASLGAVIPIYVLDDESPGRWRMGAAQRWWLHHSLCALRRGLEDKGSRLILRRGSAVTVLRQLLEETGAGSIHAIAHDEPWWRQAEKELQESLRLHDGNHLVPLDRLVNQAGGQYRISRRSGVPFSPCYHQSRRYPSLTG